MESIDRLREYVHGNCATDNELAILRIADAIEREVDDNARFRAEAEPFHDRLCKAAEAREDVTLWGVDYMPALEGSDAAKVDELTRAAMNGEDVDLWGRAYTALPVDVDGVPIRIGDVMEVGNGRLDEVRFLTLNEGGWAFNDKGWVPSWSHHHAPTVEDVLREFAQAMNENMGMYTGEAIDADEWRDADNKTIAEFAAKLRLAGDE